MLWLHRLAKAPDLADVFNRVFTRELDDITDVPLICLLSADGNSAWRSQASRLCLPFESAYHQQKVFVPKIHGQIDAGTQVLDCSWLELKRSLGNEFPVSLKVVGHRVVDPALSDLVFLVVYR